MVELHRLCNCIAIVRQYDRNVRLCQHYVLLRRNKISVTRICSRDVVESGEKGTPMQYRMNHISKACTSPAPQNGKAGAKRNASAVWQGNTPAGLFAPEATEPGPRLTA
jgi:hypothetical protein